MGMRVGAALFGLFLAGAGSAATPESVVEAFHDALRGGQGEQALELMAPDAVVFEQGRAEWSREEYRKQHLAADLEAAAKLQRQVRRRHVAGGQGETATVLTEAELSGNLGGQTVRRISLETIVLVRQGDSWRIRHIHWSSRTPR